MKKGIIAMALIAATNLMAQRVILPPRPPIIPFPPIVVKLPPLQRWQAVEVCDVEITADITGVTSETTITMGLRNPNNAVVEGELSVPLPTNATVAGYALDINGKMVDGVIVEKEKARVVFDEITRQGTDPGLVEQSSGNVFKTRVYPIPANGQRTVRLKYVSQVDIIKGTQGYSSYYIQPLHFPNKLNSFKMTLNVATGTAVPKILGGELANIQFGEWKNIYTATTELKNIELTEDLCVAIMSRPEEALAIQKAADGYSYFSFNKILQIEAAPVSGQEPFILWDASLSREKSDHDAEIAFIKEKCKNATKLSLLVFRNAPEQVKVFANVAELIKTLENIVYDGGTNLEAALAAIPQKAEALLFSDGFDNLSAAIAAAPQSCRLSAFFADKEQNAPLLRGLSSKNGGICVDLRKVTTQDAISLLANPVPVVTKVAIDGNEISAVWRVDGDRLMVAGILPENSGKLEMTLRIGSQQQAFKYAVSDDVRISEGTMLRTNYGQMRINELLAEGGSEVEITALGKEFGLVTPNTSLMVLDSLEQYLRYGIRPPETLPEMRKVFDSRFTPDKNDERTSESFKLTENDMNHVEGLWKNLVSWHSRKYPRKPSVVNAEPREVEQRRSEPRSFLGRVLNAVAPGAARRETMRAPQPEPVADGVAPVEESIADFAAQEAPARKSADQSNLDLQSTKTQLNIQAWKPDTPYLKDLEANKANAYQAYLELRKSYMGVPGFFMDCSDFFASNGSKDTAIRVISNLAELELENKQLLRVLGYRLRFLGELKAAEVIFRNVIKLAPEEPQSYRDLALVLDDQERFQEAADMMMNVVKFKWDSRFPEIETIALTELNRIIVRAQRKGISISNVDPKFIHLIDTDIRAIINWDTDMSDMDIWTTDPFKEKCYYSHRMTGTGGRNSCDFTRGYGPEEFMIRDAVKGEYVIETDYYGTSTQKILGPVTLYAEVYTNYARPNEERKLLSFRLDNRKQVVKVAVINHNGTNAPETHTDKFSYQIKKGDTLESIAEHELGDPKFVDEIIKLNPGLPRNDKLPIGRIITLPPNSK